MRIWKSLATCAFIVLFASLVPGQDHKSSSAPSADGIERLGAVNFPVSCAAPVQPFFSRAVALLHSFQYGEKVIRGICCHCSDCASPSADSIASNVTGLLLLSAVRVRRVSSVSC